MHGYYRQKNRGANYLEAEKKIRALGAKAKKINDDVAIHIFLAQLNNIKGK